LLILTAATADIYSNGTPLAFSIGFEILLVLTYKVVVVDDDDDGRGCDDCDDYSHYDDVDDDR
jgi:hypothetical protein